MCLIHHCQHSDRHANFVTIGPTLLKIQKFVTVNWKNFLFNLEKTKHCLDLDKFYSRLSASDNENFSSQEKDFISECEKWNAASFLQVWEGRNTYIVWFIYIQSIMILIQ